LVSNLIVGESYTRESIWIVSGVSGDPQIGGDWYTGYAERNGNLFVFINIGVPGKTNHNYPNTYESETGRLVWYGKNSAHSAQPTFKRLFNGEIRLQAFVRWNNKDPKFVYLGHFKVVSFEDGVQLGEGQFTIRLVLEPAAINDGDEIERNDSVPHHAPLIRQVTLSVFERNPRLRNLCIESQGCACRICGFDFEKIYGDIGRNFCHVHHVVPLSEAGGEYDVDPTKDLIPVCPNCHAMLHARRPAFRPEEIIALLKSYRPI
jgi:5-methylcytosine-specific restriction protein A